MEQSAKTKSISELQAEIEAALSRLGQTVLPPGLEPLRILAPPEGMVARIALRSLDDNRQISRTADASYRDPSGSIYEVTVYYEPRKLEPTFTRNEPKSSGPDSVKSTVNAKPKAQSAFCPVAIRGGSISSTILAERR